ncbi:hypothetical protein K469DRAFT_582453, partial [Zopfia rhizophila CBS 207.26]
HFRTNFRGYNSVFAFTSIDCTPIDRGITSGVQVFQIHGAFYHVQRPLEPEPGAAPRYAQLYFHDP